MAKKLFQYKITIKTLNQENLFNKLYLKNIKISALKRKSRQETEFIINSSDLNSTRNFLIKENIEILNIEPVSFNSFLQQILKRSGIFIAIIVLTVIMFVGNKYVLKMNINGLKYLNNSEISEFLKDEYHIRDFSDKNLIKPNEIEQGLLENFPEISMVSVMVKGLTLIINIKEKSIDEINNINGFPNIVSNFNGRIISLNLISGTAVVKPGAIVKKGDILVKAETSNSLGEIKNIKAQAKINAEVWVQESETFWEYKTQIIETGNKITKRIVYLGNIELFNNDNANTFSKFNIEEKEITPYNILLPIKVKYITFKEVQEQQIHSNFEEEKNDIFSRLKENALQNLEENDIINHEEFVISNFENGVNIELVLTVERCINV